MSDAAVAEPPAATEATAESTETPGSRFEAVKASHATNAVPADQQQAPPVNTPGKAKAEPAKAGEAKSKGDASDIPEQFLTGEVPKEEKVEVADDDGKEFDTPPASLSEKGKKSWALLREREKNATLREAAALKKIEALEKATPRVDEAMAAKYKAVEQERDEARQGLSKAAYEKTPEMLDLRSAVSGAIADAKTYVPEAVPKGIVEVALDFKGHARLEYLEGAGLSPTQATAVDACLRDAEGLKKDFDSRLAKHNEGMATHEQRAKARAEQEKQAQIDEAGKVFDNVLKTLIPKLAPLQKLDPDKYPEWNARAEEIPKRARRMFTNDLELAEAAELAVLGASADEYRRIAETLQGRLKEANATIAKLTAGQPGAGSQTNGQFVASNDASVNTPEGLKAARTKEFDAMRPS